MEFDFDIPHDRRAVPALKTHKMVLGKGDLWSNLVRGVGRAVLHDALGIETRDVDFVTLHLPRTAETVGVVGAAELAAMRPTAYLVNAARGGLVDEGALVEALESGTIAGISSCDNALAAWNRRSPEMIW